MLLLNKMRRALENKIFGAKAVAVLDLLIFGVFCIWIIITSMIITREMSDNHEMVFRAGSFKNLTTVLHDNDHHLFGSHHPLIGILDHLFAETCPIFAILLTVTVFIMPLLPLGIESKSIRLLLIWLFFHTFCICSLVIIHILIVCLIGWEWSHYNLCMWGFITYRLVTLTAVLELVVHRWTIDSIELFQKHSNGDYVDFDAAAIGKKHLKNSANNKEEKQMAQNMCNQIIASNELLKNEIWNVDGVDCDGDNDDDEEHIYMNMDGYLGDYSEYPDLYYK